MSSEYGKIFILNGKMHIKNGKNLQLEWQNNQ